MKTASVFFAVCLLAVTSSAFGGQAANVPSSIQDYYRKRDGFVIAKNSSGMQKLIESTHVKGYEGTSLPDKTGKSKKTNLAHLVESMNKLFATYGKIDGMTSKFTHVTSSKDSAVVTVASEMHGSVKDPDGQPHTVAASGTNVDTWVRVGGSWKIKTSKTASSKILIDGKAVNR